ncbi:MAG: hypothetical protein WBX14_13315 [Candidatus Udaeobacter sp.]
MPQNFLPPTDAVDDVELEAALPQDPKDVQAGRVRPIEEVKTMIP